jgi:hypothetical protein
LEGSRYTKCEVCKMVRREVCGRKNLDIIWNIWFGWVEGTCVVEKIL